MISRRILPAMLAATLVVGSTLSPAFASEREGAESAREVAALRAATVTPAAAIAAAESATGGRAIRIGLEDENGTHLYEVRVAVADRMLTVKIDPASGAVRATERDGLIARLLDREDRDEVAALLRAPTTLAKAIEAAETTAGGRTIEAGWEAEDGTNGFEVEVMRPDGRVVKVAVDAATGQARALPAGGENR
ncbi:PepSY domain-containing protein [Rhodovarius lipocyclicus]|uniref:PepSY domain-containing protein n=1 Tax=Rhodovarius lipocyclicus TaxID=268410 RepID=UPI00135BEDD7|nr:PepSY domain-containing protein [Rhodovarius lipocyclicus]